MVDQISALEEESQAAEKMNVTSIMYHDVAEAGAYDASGFPGSDAALYKVTRDQFDSQLSAIALTGVKPFPIMQLLARPQSAALVLTFDDGGVSAHTIIADALQKLSWSGHFFVTAGYVGKESFLSRKQIKELHGAGHVIGSHSYSHPTRMSYCTPKEIGREWSQSIDLLSDVLGEQVRVASVPGGFYSQTVAEKAAEAGIEVLFTSEPTTRCRTVNGCLVLGRYTIQRWMSPHVVASLVEGQGLARPRQVLLWNIKKATKAVGGSKYLRLRKNLSEKWFGKNA